MVELEKSRELLVSSRKTEESRPRTYDPTRHQKSPGGIESHDRRQGPFRKAHPICMTFARLARRRARTSLPPVIGERWREEGRKYLTQPESQPRHVTHPPTSPVLAGRRNSTHREKGGGRGGGNPASSKTRNVFVLGRNNHALGLMQERKHVVDWQRHLGCRGRGSASPTSSTVPAWGTQRPLCGADKRTDSRCVYSSRILRCVV